jgi:hypothetical protein
MKAWPKLFHTIGRPVEAPKDLAHLPGIPGPHQFVGVGEGKMYGSRHVKESGS